MRLHAVVSGNPAVAARSEDNRLTPEHMCATIDQAHRNHTSRTPLSILEQIENHRAIIDIGTPALEIQAEVAVERAIIHNKIGRRIARRRMAVLATLEDAAHLLKSCTRTTGMNRLAHSKAIGLVEHAFKHVNPSTKGVGAITLRPLVALSIVAPVDT